MKLGPHLAMQVKNQYQTGITIPKWSLTSEVVESAPDFFGIWSFNPACSACLFSLVLWELAGLGVQVNFSSNWDAILTGLIIGSDTSESSGVSSFFKALKIKKYLKLFQQTAEQWALAHFQRTTQRARVFKSQVAGKVECLGKRLRGIFGDFWYYNITFWSRDILSGSRSK
jgi:hypothetical protein